MQRVVGQTAPGHCAYYTYSEFVSCNNRPAFPEALRSNRADYTSSQIRDSRAEAAASEVHLQLQTHPTFGVVWGCFGAAKADSLQMLCKHLQLFPAFFKQTICSCSTAMKGLATVDACYEQHIFINPAGKLQFSQKQQQQQQPVSPPATKPLTNCWSATGSPSEVLQHKFTLCDMQLCELVSHQSYQEEKLYMSYQGHQPSPL